MTRSFTRLAWSAAACTYLLIILGAIVRITGSGMGCGDHWPLCNGKLLPPLDLPTLIEYGHRLAAALVSVLVSALAAYAWWLRRGAGSGERYVPSRTAYVALGLLIVQVLLGAVTVKLELPPWTVILHLGTAMLLLATLFGYAVGWAWRARARAAWGVVALVTLQVAVAAAMVLLGLPRSLQAVHVAVGAGVWAWIVITAGEEAGKGPGKGEGPLPPSPFPGI